METKPPLPPSQEKLRYRKYAWRKTPGTAVILKRFRKHIPKTVVGTTEPTSYRDARPSRVF